ncbi:MAG: hypothetical protein AB8B62_06955 [Roseobacter sp.]
MCYFDLKGHGRDLSALAEQRADPYARVKSTPTKCLGRDHLRNSRRDRTYAGFKPGKVPVSLWIEAHQAAFQHAIYRHCQTPKIISHIGRSFSKIALRTGLPVMNSPTEFVQQISEGFSLPAGQGDKSYVRA